MTFLRAALLGVFAFVLAVGAAPRASADDDLVNDIIADIVRGKTIAPVKLKIPKGVDPLSVYLGSYLIEAVATCNSCHSSKEYTATGNPFNGQKKQVNTACYMNGGQEFGPGLVSRNITPDKTGKPAGLTFAVFVNVMRTGHDPENPGTLLQVMPWDGFQSMTTTDLQAMYNYLSSIPSLPNGGKAPC